MADNMTKAKWDAGATIRTRDVAGVHYPLEPLYNELKNYGTTSGGSGNEAGQYIVGRRRCDTPLLSTAYAIGPSNSVTFKVEFSDDLAANVSGYVIGYDANDTAFVIGTFSSVNTGLAHGVIPTLENNTGSATHGLEFAVEPLTGTKSLALYITSDIGSGKWVSVWASAQ
jgi:hypothetical protein